MQVMEQIHVRLTGANREEVLRNLAAPRPSTGQEAEVRDIRVYRHAALGTDFCVLILRSTEVSAEPSELGVQLAAGLSQVGIVHHTLWIANGERR